MKTFVFSIVWTQCVALGLFFWSDDPEFLAMPWYFQVMSSGMVAFGLWFILFARRRVLRNQSLRISHYADGPVYHWVAIGGAPASSRTDPSPQWAEEDRLDDP